MNSTKSLCWLASIPLRSSSQEAQMDEKSSDFLIATDALLWLRFWDGAFQTFQEASKQLTN